jgi:shikimate 5-dehydrogenase
MMAKALAENGAAKVYIVGRREDKLREAAQFHPRLGLPKQIQALKYLHET